MSGQELEVRKYKEKTPSDFKYQGPAYFAEDASAQVENEREHGLSTGKVIHASSSGIVGTLSDGRSRIITSQEIPPADEIEDILQNINTEGYIYQAGALAFGRNKGAATHAVSMYVQTILRDDLQVTQLPDPTQVHTYGNISVYGYVKYVQDSSTGIMEARHFPLGRENSDGEVVRAFMSGRTPLLLEFAEEVCRFDEKTGPMIGELVGRYPFNNLVFRSKFAKSGYTDLEKFYREIIADRKIFFEENGGDCTIFSLEAADRLRDMGLDPKILVYPSTKMIDGKLQITSKYGHNAVVVEDPDSQLNIKYYIDPGYSVPWAVPIHQYPVPLYPRTFGGGKSMVTQNIRGNPVVELVVHNQAKRHLAGEQVMDPTTFEKMAPTILAKTHYKNDIIKLDYQDQSGRRSMGIRYSCSQRTVTCMEAGIDKLPLQQFFEDNTLQEKLARKCEEIGVSFDYILDELNCLPKN